MNALRKNSGLATVLVFALACVVGFLFLWAKSGGSVPGFTESNDYSYGGINWNWAPHPKITMYQNGLRVFGDEPCPGLFIPPPN